MRPIYLIASAAIWVEVTCCPTSAQSVATPQNDSSHSSVGSSIRPPVETPRTFGPSAGSEILRHRDLTGKPCLVVTGSARSRAITPNLYDHVIMARNNCPQRIAVQVCYYQSRECIPMEIPGGERKEAILGTMPSGKDFRFEFREKF